MVITPTHKLLGMIIAMLRILLDYHKVPLPPRGTIAKEAIDLVLIVHGEQPLDEEGDNGRHS